MPAVMILCAGTGSRLAPLTDYCAKPAILVGSCPMITHVESRVAAVATRIVVNVHHRADDVRSVVGKGVVVSSEGELLGTAGGVAHARALLGAGPVLVWNGDVFADIDARALVRAHEEHAGEGGSRALATLAVRAAVAPPGHGNVGLDAAGFVVRLRRETVRAGEVASVEFLGVHVLAQGLRDLLPERGCLVGDVYLPALRSGARLRAYWHEGVFVDVGTPAGYLEANEIWRAAREQGDASWIATTARVEAGVTVRRGVVGERAQVIGSGVLSDVVVWPGAVARAPLARAIVTRWGVVSVPTR
jgi:mannose-1-phosphate guanylyltransferase